MDLNLVSPDEVLARLAKALPEACRPDVIIIGSLAAGWHFADVLSDRGVRTKDIDCMFSPHAKAVASAHHVTEQLLGADWTLRPGKWGKPGTSDTPTHQLPLVRLLPPQAKGEGHWFVELLGAPDLSQPTVPEKDTHRVTTLKGDFCLASFRFLGVAELDPLCTPHGLRVARPEMMALANLLHHPHVAPKLIEGTSWKRSNKDLGRVIALAWLAMKRDQRCNTDDFDSWAANMTSALRRCFQPDVPNLVAQLGGGLKEMLGSPVDRREALEICNLGLLAGQDVSQEAFNSMGARVLADVIERVERELG
jgi:hypothetical protein